MRFQKGADRAMSRCVFVCPGIKLGQEPSFELPVNADVEWLAYGGILRRSARLICTADESSLSDTAFRFLSAKDMWLNTPGRNLAGGCPAFHDSWILRSDNGTGFKDHLRSCIHCMKSSFRV